MVLLMGWMDSPKFFCAFLETLTDVANSLVNPYLHVLAYGAISDLPPTGTYPPPTHRRLTHIDWYINDIISTVYGGPEQQN